MAASRKTWRTILIVLGTIVIAAIVAVSLYVLHLDRLVTKQFEGRRWTLPAQVYAAPLELYAGLGLPADEIERELKRLQYQEVQELTRPGGYRKRGNRIDVALRPARFADESRPAQVLTIGTSAAGISSLRDSGGRELPIVRLEPLLIGSIFPTHGEDRIVVTPDEVPPLLPQALKAVEDRNFDTHHGVDPWAILRALWINLRAGQVEQGGSTLTQQLVKSYFLDPSQTMSRKVREAIMAMALDAHFSKADIMNAYINEIHLGQDGNRAIHGFGLASQYYFGKPLAELELHQIATLVAIARGPSYYEPRRNPKRAQDRRDLVLNVMADLEMIPRAQAQAAKKKPLGVIARNSGGYYPAYLDLVRRTLRRDYREEDLTESGLRIYTNLEPRAQELAERTLERELARLDEARKKKQKGKDDGAKLEGSVVITSPQSGDVIAVLGGRRAGYSGFNRALDARRPIGSLIKPFIFLAALETGRYNATTIVMDEPVDIALSRGKRWKPENYTREIYGPVPMVRALAESLNLSTVHIGMDVGLPSVTRTLERFGLTREPQKVPSILLGAVDATPLEVAQLYNGLANGGFRTPMRAVRAVLSEDGKALKAFPVEVTPVAEGDVVYQVDEMMKQVMLHGTGRSALQHLPPSLVVAGKSGTSSDLRDSWFAGFSGSHLAVVWVGFDDNRVTGLSGSTGALPIWARLMGGLDTTSINMALPESLVEVQVEYRTGMRADPTCGEDVITVVVPPGAEPPLKPVCGGGPTDGPVQTLDTVVERAGQWIRDIIR